jgi:ABC-type nitrate/sulfonate/bicarbonate transport system permease component
MNARMIQLAAVLAVLAAWHLVTASGLISPIFLPALPEVWRQLVRIVASGQIVEPLTVTLTEVIIAYTIAALAGIAVGYLASLSPFAVRVFEPLFSSIYAIPIVILFPLCILFFGIGPESKIAFGATYGFFPIVLNTIAGFGHVDARYVRWARSMGASESQLFRHVMLPAALPVVMSGLRIGFVITFASTVGGETLASLQGLGNRIVYFGELMRGAEMFAYIAFVIAFAFLVNALSLLLESRGRRR